MYIGLPSKKVFRTMGRRAVAGPSSKTPSDVEGGFRFKGRKGGLRTAPLAFLSGPLVGQCHDPLGGSVASFCCEIRPRMNIVSASSGRYEAVLRQIRGRALQGRFG